MNSERIALLERAGVYKTGRHFVISPHTHCHSGSFIDLAPVLNSADLLSHIIRSLVEQYRNTRISAVVYPKSCETYGATFASELGAVPLCAEHIEHDQFVIPYNARKVEGRDAVKQRNILVFNSVIASGSTTRGLMRTVRNADGVLIGVAAICDRRRASDRAIHGESLETYTKMELESFEHRRCPLCQRGMPVDESVGWGREWVAQQKRIAKQYGRFPR